MKSIDLIPLRSFLCNSLCLCLSGRVHVQVFHGGLSLTSISMERVWSDPISWHHQTVVMPTFHYFKSGYLRASFCKRQYRFSYNSSSVCVCFLYHMKIDSQSNVSTCILPNISNKGNWIIGNGITITYFKSWKCQRMD